AGRLTSTTNSFDQGQTQAIYPASLMTVQTLTRTQANVPDASAVQVFDGVGRVRATSRDMMAKVNNVDTLHHSAQKFVFDQMGRLVNQSNSTEVTDSWVPTGTDTTWYYTAQAYDWKGRPTDTTNTDGTQKHTFYGGCGCAGGEVVTMTDENGRQQVVTHDVLGRVIETKTLNWDG